MSTETTPLHITREGPRSFIGRNARGAEVRIGGSDADGVFSPGELLHLALAACGGSLGYLGQEDARVVQERWQRWHFTRCGFRPICPSARWAGPSGGPRS